MQTSPEHASYTPHDYTRSDFIRYRYLRPGTNPNLFCRPGWCETTDYRYLYRKRKLRKLAKIKEP